MSAAAAADWRSLAACRGQDTNRWYGKPHQVGHALATCARCPVRAECLLEALRFESDQHYGVWGGLTPVERRPLRALPAAPGDALAALRDLIPTLTHPEGPAVTQPVPQLAAIPEPPLADQHEPPALPVGQLLKWGDDHDDPDVRDQAARARVLLTGLRRRHAADAELAAITSEAEELEQRLAELRAREAELAPVKAKKKRRTVAYVRDYDSRTVRAWAAEQGIDCPRVGQVPKAVVDAWRAAQSG
ncbi:WhiB family transcriptional regulator [Streptomyces griseosporeus]|uniref:WhiB family transcriptional regulator n=1 Tax=Streptomyces griseosporeus TaxID=1910 RepID=UPI0036FD2BB5